MAFLVGDTIRLKATIKDYDGNETAPPSITLTIYLEDGVTKILSSKAATLVVGTTAQYYVDWTISGTSYKASFDLGDSSNPIEVGDNLTGDHATPGDGLCIAITYLTAAAGTITYTGTTHNFINDEVITGGGNTVKVNGTPAVDSDYLVGPASLIALWEWTGPHKKTIKFEIIPAV